MVYEITVSGVVHQVEVERQAGALHCKVDGKIVPADVFFPQRGMMSLLVDGRSYEIRVEDNAEGADVIVAHRGKNERLACQIRDPRALRGHKSAGASAEGPKKITAPMPGKVVRILATAGSQVELGQGVIVIEAMKMQNELKAPKSGRVAKILPNEGAAVNPGDTLAIIE